MAIEFIQNFMLITMIVFTIRHWRLKLRIARLNRMTKEMELHQHFLECMARLCQEENEFRLQLVRDLDQFIPRVCEARNVGELMKMLPEAQQLSVTTKAKMKDFTAQLAERHYKILGEHAALGHRVLMFHYAVLKA